MLTTPVDLSAGQVARFDKIYSNNARPTQPLNGRVVKVSQVAARLLFALALLSGSALADEGGVSFWVPGTFASFAATRSAPGWSMPLVYYHRDTDTRDEDLVYAVPTYASNSPLAGTQAVWSLGVPFGRVSAAGDSRTSVGDLYPALTLKSGRGERTYMSYTMLGVPTGPAGTNHWSLDGGGGFTFLNEASGREFSAVLGFTYNFRNPDTDYRNGASSHLDWAASQPLSPDLPRGRRGLFLLPARRGPRPGRAQVARLRRRSAGAVDARQVERGCQGLLRVRRPQPAGGLECPAHGCPSSRVATRSGRIERKPIHRRLKKPVPGSAA